MLKTPPVVRPALSPPRTPLAVSRPTPLRPPATRPALFAAWPPPWTRATATTRATRCNDLDEHVDPAREENGRAVLSAAGGRPDPDKIPAVLRLRRLLKYAGRVCLLRCSEVSASGSEHTGTAHDQPEQNQDKATQKNGTKEKPDSPDLTAIMVRADNTPGGGDVIIDPKGFETLEVLKMFSDKQAQGRGIRAYPRAMICRWAGSKALRGSLVLLETGITAPVLKGFPMSEEITVRVTSYGPNRPLSLVYFDPINGKKVVKSNGHLRRA